MKREFIYILALIIMANVIVWLVLPVKNNPYLEQQLKDEKAQRELYEKENDSIKLHAKTKDRKNDSLLNVIKLSNNELWRTKQTIKKLRDRKPDDSLLDSLIRARRND